MTEQETKKPRNYPTMAFSFPPDLAEYIEHRWKELRPTVSSRSHYLQLLVEAERTGQCDVFPKEESQLLLAGMVAA